MFINKIFSFLKVHKIIIEKNYINTMLKMLKIN